MDIAYFGSPDISAELLEMIVKDSLMKVKIVVTQPDRPVGKRLELTATPVKTIARKYNIPVFDRDLKKDGSQTEFLAIIKKEHISLGILFAYGALIKDEVINSFENGIWNVHPSLLPCYRGPSPTAYPLMLGDLETGVTLMKLVKKLDAGPIISQSTLDISTAKNKMEVESSLISQGHNLIEDALKELSTTGSLPTRTQDEQKSTYTRLLHKEDGYICSQLINKAFINERISLLDFPTIIKDYIEKYGGPLEMDSGRLIWNMYRGLSPWPGIWTRIETPQGSKRLKLIELNFENERFKIEKVQLEGKNEVDFETFNKAYNFLD